MNRVPDDLIAELADVALTVLDELCSAVTMALPDEPSSVLHPMIKAILGEAATQQWVADQLEQTGIRMTDFRNGLSMELAPARDMAAIWVGMCRGLIGEGRNYSETAMDHLPDIGSEIELKVGLAETPDRYIITVKRDRYDAMTPHQARERAEKVIDDVWTWLGEVNDGAGWDTGDLALILERGGFPPSVEEGEEG